MKTSFTKGGVDVDNYTQQLDVDKIDPDLSRKWNICLKRAHDYALSVRNGVLMDINFDTSGYACQELIGKTVPVRVSLSGGLVEKVEEFLAEHVYRMTAVVAC